MIVTSMVLIAPRKLAVRFTAALIVALGCLMLAEVILRLSGRDPVFLNPLNSFHTGDPELGWVGVPDFSGRFHRRDFNVRIVNGPRGFRLGASRVIPATGAKRVIFLGDSFTWGWGVEQGEVFTDRLQDLVGPQFELHNRAVNAWGTVQQSILLEQLLEEDQPHQVVVMLFRNDYVDNLDSKRGRRPYIHVEGDAVNYAGRPVDRQIGGLWRDLRRRSAALSLLGEGWNRIQRLKDEQLGPAVPRPDALFHPKPAQVRALETSLDYMHSLCKGRCELTLVFVPAEEEVLATGPAPAATAAAVIGEKLGLGFSDLTSDFRRAAQHLGAPLYFAHDDHWSPEGHRVAAAAIARRLFGVGSAEKR